MIIPQGTGLLTCFIQYLLGKTQSETLSLKATTSVLFQVWGLHIKNSSMQAQVEVKKVTSETLGFLFIYL